VGKVWVKKKQSMNSHIGQICIYSLSSPGTGKITPESRSSYTACAIEACWWGGEEVGEEAGDGASWTAGSTSIVGAFPDRSGAPLRTIAISTGIPSAAPPLRPCLA
jgi:hypothetical protein